MLASSHKLFPQSLLDPYGAGSGRQGDTFSSADFGSVATAPDFGQTPHAAETSDGASGTGGTSTPVVASGNQNIDGLLSGVKWSASAISYTDPDAAGDYQAGYFFDIDGDAVSAQNDGFARISASQLLAVHSALNGDIISQPAGAYGFGVEAFTDLGISYGVGGSGDGTIRVANTSDNNYGYTFYPASSIYGGDAWMGSQIQAPVQGNYGWNNTLHELGHAMGLKHGHETGGGNPALPTNVDSLEFTLMTYRSYIGGPTTGYTNGTWDYPQTYMMLDIAALQYMYGADFTTSSANIGDTTYTWSQTTGQGFVNGLLGTNPGGNRVFETIWDGGGTDTYDLSNYTVGMTINLKPGEWSTFDANQLANLGNGHIARGNLANALQYQGDIRSLIENANGGSGNDHINGNAAANTLRGNGGDDTLRGWGGADTMYGGVGKDTYYVDNAGDIASENGGGGHDLVISKVSFALGNGLNDLTLIGGNKLNGAGNGGNNVITGNKSHNELTGAAGRDTFVFDTLLANTRYDTITDFRHSLDTFGIDDSVFVGLALGTLANSAFKLIPNGSSTAGVDGSDRILYDARHGNLFFDQDGSGSTFDRIKFAHVDPNTLVDNTDFFVI